MLIKKEYNKLVNILFGNTDKYANIEKYHNFEKIKDNIKIIEHGNKLVLIDEYLKNLILKLINGEMEIKKCSMFIQNSKFAQAILLGVHLHPTILECLSLRT